MGKTWKERYFDTAEKFDRLCDSIRLSKDGCIECPFYEADDDTCTGGRLYSVAPLSESESTGKGKVMKNRVWSEHRHHFWQGVWDELDDI